MRNRKMYSEQSRYVINILIRATRPSLGTMYLICVIEKCISREFIDIVDSNVARKYASASEASPTLGCIYIYIRECGSQRVW